MAYVKNLFDKNFIEYASYVIRDRAIPDMEDGLKPVQRRILHTMLEKDDGRYTKVAKVCGDVMTYHPHGDSSIYMALVNLANKELFIEKQGNFGNLYTGDGPAAPRYIECRLSPLAKDILYNPEITQYVPSYDGRGKEPVAFRAKLPLAIIMGAEGIAVGMSTKILSHNIKEVIEAEKKCLKGEEFKLYPDFQTGGILDVSDYQDGKGKVVSRVKFDTSDPKKIIIKELAFGSSTESLIQSVESAYKAGKIKISSINDYTTDKVEVEIKLPRNVHADEVIDSLYAFTECEQSISCNLLLIKDNMPQIMTVTEVIEHHSKQLVSILNDELDLEKRKLLDVLHQRTLERIFVEEKIYKVIEQMKTEKDVIKAVAESFVPYRKELLKDVSNDDIDKLLKIPIRRISLYDINKNRKEVQTILSRLKEIEKLLRNITEYAVSYLDKILSELDPSLLERKTVIKNFGKIDIKEVVKRETPLFYDEKMGFLGMSVTSGKELFKVSPYDRILLFRKDGSYSVSDVPDKIFVEKGLYYCGLASKEELSKVTFSIVYKEKATGYAYIKRCKIEQFILNKTYQIVPDESEILLVCTDDEFAFNLKFKPKPRLKYLSQTFLSKDYLVKGVKAGGVRLAAKETEKAFICENSADLEVFTEQGELEL